MLKYASTMVADRELAPGFQRGSDDLGIARRDPVPALRIEVMSSSPRRHAGRRAQVSPTNEVEATRRFHRRPRPRRSDRTPQPDQPNSPLRSASPDALDASHPILPTQATFTRSATFELPARSSATHCAIIAPLSISTATLFSLSPAFPCPAASLAFPASLPVRRRNPPAMACTPRVRRSMPRMSHRHAVAAPPL